MPSRSAAQVSATSGGRAMISVPVGQKISTVSAVSDQELDAVLERPAPERLPAEQGHRQQGDHGSRVRGGRRAQCRQEGAGPG